MGDVLASSGPGSPPRPGSDPPAPYLVVSAVVLLVVLLPLALLVAVAGSPAGGVGLALLTMVTAMWLLWARPRPPWLVWLFPAALVVVAVLGVTATRTIQPDPFGLAVGADVEVDCGSVLDPGGDDYGCASWRDDQRALAEWAAGVAVVVTGAVVVPVVRRRLGDRRGTRPPATPGPS